MEKSEEVLANINLDPNDHILVSLESQDLWISCLLDMNSPDYKNFTSTFEIKVDMTMTGLDLKS